MRKNIIFKISIFLLSMALVAGVYTFIVVPAVEKEQKEIYEKKIEMEMHTYINVLTYTGDTPLLEDTIITDAVIEHFKTVQMPIGCVTSDYVSDFEAIKGLQLKYAICNGQQLSYQNFKSFLKDIEGNERLKEFEICSLVAGQAMPGRFADILLRYSDGSTAVVVPKIQIYDIQSQIEKRIEITNGESKMHTVVFAVTEEEYNDLISAGKEGVFDLRIYLNESQPASEKDYRPISVVI